MSTKEKSTFKLLGLNHLGIIAKDPKQAQFFFEDVLGLNSLGSEIIEEQKTEVEILSLKQNTPLSFEFLQATQEDSPITNFINQKGSGVHHIALEVDDLSQALKHLKANNIQLIDNQIRIGAHKSKIAFVHPRGTGGILVELVELYKK